MIAAMQTKGHGRGKSGLRRAGCQITSGGGDSQDSATEIYRASNEAGSRNACIPSLNASYIISVRVERQCKRLPCWW